MPKPFTVGDAIEALTQANAYGKRLQLSLVVQEGKIYVVAAAAGRTTEVIWEQSPWSPAPTLDKEELQMALAELEEANNGKDS